MYELENPALCYIGQFCQSDGEVIYHQSQVLSVEIAPDKIRSSSCDTFGLSVMAFTHFLQLHLHVRWLKEAPCTCGIHRRSRDLVRCTFIACKFAALQQCEYFIGNFDLPLVVSYSTNHWVKGSTLHPKASSDITASRLPYFMAR